MGDALDQADLGQRAWHAVETGEVVEAFGTDPQRGLDEAAAAQRLQRCGPNRLTPLSERGMLARLLGQFRNVFIYLLVAAAVVTALLGEWIDSGVIAAVVLVIAIIGFVQEGRAERALEAVRGMLTARAQVVRDGEARDIAAEELVPGDVVALEAGAGVPADIRVLRSRNLQAQEAALTGESAAVAKHARAVDEGAVLGDRACMVYSGTVLTAGSGRGVVVATGDATEIGRISGMLSEVDTLKTPLTRRLDNFARVLSVAIVALSAVTFAVGVLVWGHDWGEMFFAAVSIAVAAIPEGLPAVMTVTLAIGVRRMAVRKAIIRRLPAVETLGSVTVVCSDKTGTLTRNEMTVRTIRTALEDIHVQGVGYEPQGSFQCDGSDIPLQEHPWVCEMIRAGLLCNDSRLRREGDQWKPEGDPTETALIVLARKAELDPDREGKTWPRVDVIPFESERRYMATLNRDPEGRQVLYLKGAPEQVLAMCSSEQRGQHVVDLEPDAWRRRVDAIAQRGQRVLAVARRELDSTPDELGEEHVGPGLVLLGFFGLVDPPREEAISAVAECQRAGIRVKMITGDHALTAQAIARELGLEHPDRVLSGSELDQESADTLRTQALETDVFARASPEHKLRLVEALQADGAIIAMTGDGVNDAPALKRADIGIAMGLKGTDAAREAAAMVLADDNFASIQRAIEEGRAVYDNLKKAILFILPTNVGEAALIVLAILFGMVLPIAPVQILWVNMITAATLGMAFAWEPAEGRVMLRPPRPPREPLLTGFMIWRCGFVGLLLLLGTGGLFLYEMQREGNTIDLARTVAVNTLVMSEITYLWSARFFRAPSWTVHGLFGSRAVLLAVAVCASLQLLFVYLPIMNRLFSTVPLPLEAWVRCLGVAVGVFVIVELEKTVLRSRTRRHHAKAVGGERR